MSKIRYVFTAVPNKLFEKVLISDFSKRQLNILLQIWRGTFGCRKSVLIYKPSEFAWCGVSRTTIKAELQELARMRVISLDEKLGLIAMNPRLEEWTCPPHSANTPDRISQIRNEVLSKQLKGRSILLTEPVERFNEYAMDDRLKETLKKLNAGETSPKEMREAAEAYGPDSASASLARKMRTE